MKADKRKYPMNTIMLGIATDMLTDIRYTLAPDENKETIPEHITPVLLGMKEHGKHEKKKGQDGSTCSFDDAESFDAARKRIMRG